MKKIPKVRIHMSTLKTLADRCRKSGYSAVDLVCSIKSGRIIAYPTDLSGISPGSWCQMYHDLYPIWENGRFVGTMHDDEIHNYSGVFSNETALNHQEKILYEIVVVPDSVPEDLSALRRST